MTHIPSKVYHGILEDRTGRRKCAIKKLKKEDQIEEKKLLQEVTTQKIPLIKNSFKSFEYSKIIFLKQATLWSGIYDDSIVGFIGIRNMLCSMLFIFI